MNKLQILSFWWMFAGIILAIESEITTSLICVLASAIIMFIGTVVKDN